MAITTQQWSPIDRAAVQNVASEADLPLPLRSYHQRTATHCRRQSSVAVLVLSSLVAAALWHMCGSSSSVQTFNGTELHESEAFRHLGPENRTASHSHGLYQGAVDVHGIAEHSDVQITRALTAAACRLALGAMLITVVSVVQQGLTRTGRSILLLSTILASAAIAVWYSFTSQVEANGTTSSYGIYDDAFDVHGVTGGGAAPAAEVLAIVAGRLALAAFIIIVSVAMRRMLLRTESFALLSILAVAYLWHCMSSFSPPIESVDSHVVHQNAPDAHGGAVAQSKLSVTDVLTVVAARLAVAFIVVLAGALARRFLSRIGLVQSRSRSPVIMPSVAVPLQVMRRRVQLPGTVEFIKNNSLLFTCFAVWYYGNYQHNICNKIALRATNGADGFPLTIATCQLLVGVLYAVFAWVAPDMREKPTITMKDWRATLPVSFAAAGAHAGSVFAVSAGALSFGQIVKSCEPAFAALIGTLFYGCVVSKARWMCLIPIIGGVSLSAVAELDFTWAALLSASLANVFAAVRSNENKKLLAAEGIKDRLGSVGNQYAITTINAFIFLAPLAIYREGHKLHLFIEACKSDKDVLYNVVMSGWWFYIYNEVATIIIKKTGAVTQSIANTAKRAVIILLAAVVLGESLSVLKLVGCTIAIGGVFLYSEIDKLVEKAGFGKEGSAELKMPQQACEVSNRKMSVDEAMLLTPQNSTDKKRQHLDTASTMASGSPCMSDSDATPFSKQSAIPIIRVGSEVGGA